MTTANRRRSGGQAMADGDVIVRPEAKAGERSRAPAPVLPLREAAKPRAETPPASRRKLVRRVLLLLGPLLVIAVGLYLYLTGGRYVSTDNAYVQADKLAVSTDVSGVVAEVAVRENQRVESGQLLFRLD